jgi:diaminopimelate epimerase
MAPGVVLPKRVVVVHCTISFDREDVRSHRLKILMMVFEDVVTNMCATVMCAAAAVQARCFQAAKLRNVRICITNE